MGAATWPSGEHWWPFAFPHPLLISPPLPIRSLARSLPPPPPPPLRLCLFSATAPLLHSTPFELLYVSPTAPLPRHTCASVPCPHTEHCKFTLRTWYSGLKFTVRIALRGRCVGGDGRRHGHVVPSKDVAHAQTRGQSLNSARTKTSQWVRVARPRKRQKELAHAKRLRCSEAWWLPWYRQ